MKTAENSTALLKTQEQELRQAVSFAVELATKAGASAEVSVTKVSGLSVSARLQDWGSPFIWGNKKAMLLLPI